ncbi:MAG: bifunctional adenosylcobinamide kinase/adenosylcobinamide-phosphate guanylyltransferase [Heliobacteriaceae bacterium]|nr:bifunctional adenosylcobinamide kinase/adenosylcobinamide-phosphate guanylyltransferase [Heliobacteriaceae bacterium]MDD4587895.1 bifunctional adenosylcobinamide kinase/adenosylcobinamide-phosphate guanylyltransferase [Heliobacteriaceae bacterium]
MHIQPGELVLVTGGARSGKSAWAEQLAKEVAAGDRQVIYVATAGVHDAEMSRRVALHRQRRPAHWQTVEEPVALEKVLQDRQVAGVVLLIDCLTLWVSNLLLPVFQEQDWNREKEQALVERGARLAAAARQSPATVIVVGNETGWGIVPADPLARAFRDVAGWVQQRFAREAHRVYLTVCGLPVPVKVPAGRGGVSNWPGL